MDNETIVEVKEDEALKKEGLNTTRQLLESKLGLATTRQLLEELRVRAEVTEQLIIVLLMETEQ